MPPKIEICRVNDGTVNLLLTKIVTVTIDDYFVDSSIRNEVEDIHEGYIWIYIYIYIYIY